MLNVSGFRAAPKPEPNEKNYVYSEMNRSCATNRKWQCEWKEVQHIVKLVLIAFDYTVAIEIYKAKKKCEPMKWKKETTWVAIVPEIRTLNAVWEINTLNMQHVFVDGMEKQALKKTVKLNAL